MNKRQFETMVDVRCSNWDPQKPYIAIIKNKGRTRGVGGNSKQEAKDNLWDYLTTYVLNK